MKIPLILLVFVLLICFFIGRLETYDEIVVKNINSIGKSDSSNLGVKRMLWVLLIIFQTLLSHSLLKSSKSYIGTYKILLLIAFTVALLFLFSFVYIFIISLSSFWI